ncbi:hypothetical protein TSAR_016529 [Trichomalopsis sarcophagae]|uniref:BED-type domain-containing protein n=1 Tax=Trichomalopsis sarcophagae TaxID=543379 RepID=A0A232EEF3_9HYME|nr:hypothetical protein TSAR_016529 [Trichomalopsis sarcophagae]
MTNPDLYDKLEEGFRYTAEKIVKLKDLANYLKEIEITVTVPEIVKAWKALVEAFKECRAEQNVGTGSAAKEHSFVYYQDMMFVLAKDQHRKPISTLNVTHQSKSLAKPVASQSTSMILQRKKSKLMQQDDDSLRSLNKKIIETLDVVQKGCNPTNSLTPTEEGFCYTAEKIIKLKDLANYLKEIEITVTVPEIVKAWKALVEAFKECHAEQNVGTGSVAKEYSFVYYQDMMFVLATDQHRKPISTLNVTHQSKSLAKPVASQSTSVSPRGPGAEHSSGLSASVRRHPSSLAVSGPKLPRKSVMPPLDDFAKKKSKLMQQDDDSLHSLNKKIIETLDVVQKGCNPTNSLTPTGNYIQVIDQAFSKVPDGMQDQCLQYVLNQLYEFDIPEIVKAWKALVEAFKECRAEQNVGTGSAAKEHSFVYYQDMMFVLAKDQHRKPISTLNVTHQSKSLAKPVANLFIVDHKQNDLFIVDHKQNGMQTVFAKFMKEKKEKYYIRYRKLVVPQSMRSIYWKFFGFLADENGEIVTRVRIVCLLCKAQITYNRNTSNRRMHLQNKHVQELHELEALSPPMKQIITPESKERRAQKRMLKAAMASSSQHIYTTNADGTVQIGGDIQFVTDPSVAFPEQCMEEDVTVNINKPLKFVIKDGTIDNVSTTSNQNMTFMLSEDQQQQTSSNNKSDSGAIVEFLIIDLQLPKIVQEQVDIIEQEQDIEEIDHKRNGLQTVFAKFMEEKHSITYRKLVVPQSMRSIYWKFFGFPADDDGEILTRVKIVCLLCKTQIAYNRNTSNLRMHLQNKHVQELHELEALSPPRKQIITPESKERRAQKRMLKAAMASSSQHIYTTNADGTVQIGGDIQFVTDSSVAFPEQCMEEDMTVNINKPLKFVIKDGTIDNVSTTSNQNMTFMLSEDQQQQTSSNNKSVSEAIVEFLIIDLQLPEIVQEQGFQRLIATLKSPCQIPSKNSLEKEIIPTTYNTFRETILSNISSLTSEVSLAVEEWTSNFGESFFSFLIYYQSPGEAALESKILCTIHGPRDWDELQWGTVLDTMMNDWCIKLEKTTAVIASTTRSQLTNALITRGLTVVPCLLHSLQVCAQTIFENDEQVVFSIFIQLELFCHLFL